MKDKFFKKGKWSTRKLGASVLAVAMAAIMVFTMIPSAAFATTADLDTSTGYGKSLGDNASTEYAGRIWTDKSVYDEDATFQTFGGGSITVELDENGELDEDFLVAYSALATSESVQGQTEAPVDVVLILDISGSMSNEESTMDNGKSRIYNAIQAANDAIDSLMALNEYTRVSVVAFSNNAQVLLPLDRYTKTTERQWVQTGGPWQGYYEDVEVPYFTLNRETGSDNYADLYVNAEASDGTIIEDSVDVQGGTNIQMGLYEGMNVLASEEKTTVNINGSEVQIVPSVILLSDGAPTYSSNDESWWAPADNNNDGSGRAPFAGNGMKSILVGSYMKDAIDRNYGVTDTAFSTTLYTVGVGITGLDDDEQNLAYMTLDPGTYWNDEDVVNSMKSTIKDYWGEYTANNNTGELNINVGTYRNNQSQNKNYWLQHPDTDYDVDPVAGYDYVDDYYDADDASTVTKVFEDIVSNISISAPQVPTELKGGDPIEDGYITYTDPIGEYMEVKDVKSIIYAGQEFTQKTKAVNGNVTTYTFSGTVESPVYGTQDIKNIIITVEKGADGKETLTVKIPASVIPLRVNEVTLNADGSVKSHTNNGAYPARVIYSVGLQSGIKKTDDNGSDYIDTSVLSAEYIAANTNADGEVNFYSNLFTNTNEVNGASAGDAKVEFEPSHTNPFYYIIEDMPIYKDELFTEQVTAAEGLDDDTVYYYKDVYYHGTSEEVVSVERTGAQLKLTAIKTGEDGNLYRAAGSPRLNRMLEFEGTKEKNATGTAEDFYAPTFQHKEGSSDPYEGKIVVYLGNNGLLSLPSGGNLTITKSVNAAAGLTAPDKTFEFILDLDGDKVNNGTYNYVIVDNDGKEVSKGTVSKTQNKIDLKDGQTATIYSLPPGTSYEVTEKAVDGFVMESEGSTGTIEAGVTDNAKFTNTYNVEPVLFPTDGELSGQKELKGREWGSNDSFTFYITPYNNAPLPADYDADAGVTVTEPDVTDGQTAAFDFGTIEFNAPGVYRYTIVEKEPENHEYLPGMSYSRALYRLVITVEDNGDGTLQITSSDLQRLYDDGANPLFTYNDQNEIVMNEGQEAQDKIVFTNTYSTEAVTRVPVALKDYTDNSGENPLVSGMFSFKLQAVGYIVDEGELVPGFENVPMPEDSVNGVSVTENEGHNVTFLPVKFTQDLIPDNAEKITFRYQMSEVIPTDKVNGMTYDESEYTIDVVVSIDANSEVLKVDAIYPDEERIVTFRNEYTPSPVKADIIGTKTLVGRDMNDGETFDFILGANPSTSNAIREGIVVVPSTSNEVSVAGAKDGEATGFEFEDIEFKKAGTYIFTVNETAGDSAAVDYDDTVVTVTVEIADDNNDGKLEVKSITYSNGKDRAEFTNTYTTEFEGTPVSLDGTKNLTGKTLLAGEFYFNVEEHFNGNKVSEDLVTSTGDTVADEEGVYTGSITFLKDKTYTEAGTYEYYITEQIPNPGVTGTDYDESKYRYTVVVEDVNKVGKLTVTSTKLEKADGDSWVEASAVVFNNTYEPTPTIVDVPQMAKVIVGDRAEAIKAGDFKFEMRVVSAEPADGIILPDETVVSNDAAGKINFGAITFTKAGVYTVSTKEVIPAEADRLPGVTYSEQELTTTFRVTDDRNGNLTATIINSVGGGTFFNSYEADPANVQLEIKKVLEGRDWLDSDSFDFEVVVSDPVTLQAIEDGAIEFPRTSDGSAITKLTIDEKGETVKGNININRPGTYKFMIHEVEGDIPGIHYDSVGREVIITAKDDSENAKIVVDVEILKGEEEVEGLTFTNVYDTEFTELSGHENLLIEKEFTGRENDEWLDTDEFKFILEAGDSTTETAIASGIVELPTSTELTVSNENKAHAHFGNIVFHKAGTYKFKVTEKEGTIPGVTYDTTPRVITVNVIDDTTKGVLVASIADDSDELSFANYYGTDDYVLEGVTNLKVVKYLAGRDWAEGDKFTFEIKGIGNATLNAIEAGDIIMPSAEIVIDESSEDVEHGKTANFGDITFKKPGDYRFVITEKAGSLNNVSYDEHNYNVYVSVTDNGEGELVAVPTYTGSSIFVNEYTPDPEIVAFEGTKNLTGRDLNAGEFTFELEAVTEDAPMPASAEAVNDEEGKIEFGAITYTEAGTYKYLITEKESSLPGIHIDTVPIEVTVTVTYDSANGELSADVTYDKDGEGVFEFNNEYITTKVPVSIKAVKEVKGHAYEMTAGKFKFEIEPAASNPESDPIEQKYVTHDAAGNILIDGTYAEEGTYIYTLHEAAGEHTGMVFDDSVYTIKVVVTDKDSVLQADISYLKDGEKVDRIVFENTYDPKETSAIIHGHKTLKGDKDLEEGEFEFRIKALTEGAPMPAETTVRNEATGLFQFGAITYGEVGVYEYEVSEVNEGKTGRTYDDSKYTVTVTVTDNEGVLDAEVSGVYTSDNKPVIVFENAYDPVDVTVVIGADKELKKNLEGREMTAGEFEFELLEGTEVVGTAKNDSDGHFEFEKTFDKAGDYSYTIAEKNNGVSNVEYDTSIYAVNIKVVDKDGELVVETIDFVKDNKAVDVVEFNNTYNQPTTEIQLSAVKKLEGREMTANEFEFVLEAADGTKMFAKNTADGAVVFDVIEYDAEGTYSYKLYEVAGNAENVTYDKTVHNITVTVTTGENGELQASLSTDGIAPAFVNEYNADDKGTQTGDDFNMMLYLLIAVTALGIAGTVVVRRKTN